MMNRKEKIRTVVWVLDTTSGDLLHNVAEKIVDSLEYETNSIYICKYSNPKCASVDCYHRIPHIKNHDCGWKNTHKCSGGIVGATCIKLRDGMDIYFLTIKDRRTIF